MAMIQIATVEGMKETDAVTVKDGLAIHSQFSRFIYTSYYCISHVASGQHVVGWIKTLEGAEKILDKLLAIPGIDWTQPKDQLPQDSDTINLIRQVIRP